MEFKDLELSEILHTNLASAGFVQLTKIQELAIPFALTGKDITGLAQTGTGKTLAFLVPTIHRLVSELPDPQTGLPFAIVLAPTRELVIQIADEAKKLLKNTGYTVASIIGGTDYKEQEDALKNSPGFIVATPGRLIDFIKSRNLDLSKIQVVIIDEADRMFDMGFVLDLKYIFHKCKDRKQTMMFSATLSFEVIRLAYKYLEDPVEVQVDPEKIISERIDQKLYHLGREEKLPYLVNSILENFASSEEKNLSIIFTNYKSNIPTIIRTLHRYGIPTAGLSSDFDQKKRIRLLKDFKLGKYRIMVATDVASRGIDVANIDLVFNYDLPSDSENYVHRIGRTARAGRKGKSISFCSESDYTELERIEKYLKAPIPVGAIREEFLEFPKGDFTPFESDDPAIQRGLRERGPAPKKGRHSQSRGSDRHSQGRNERPKKEWPKREGSGDFPGSEKSGSRSNGHKKPGEFRGNKSGEFSKQPRNKSYSSNSGSSYSKASVADKSRRNLFDIDQVRNQAPAKQSIWKKIKSLFGK